MNKKAAFFKIRNYIYAPVTNTRNRKISTQLQDLFVKSDSVLDVGCGDMLLGKQVKRLAKIKSWKGVDVLDYRKTNLPMVKYDGKKIPFKNKSFDTTCAVFTLHHIEDDISILREMKRVAKKNIVIVEETYDNIFRKYLTYLNDYVSNRLESLEINIPFNFHSDSEWKSIFKKLGLKLIKQKRIQQLPFPLNLTHQVVYLLEV